MLNLLKNALKFTEKGFIEFGFSVENINNQFFLKFYVKDSGIGIAPENHIQIFNMFRQVSDTRNRLYEGTGIGLAISKRLSVKLGGDMWVESELGKGATFYFTLPYKVKKPDLEIDPLSGQDEKIKLHGKTILIVEDEKFSFDYLRILCLQLGAEVLWVKTGKDAIELISANPKVDLVLMDIRMPEMDGYEAAGIIKKIKPNLTIIAQTAFARFGDNEKAISAGCDDYLTKPINRKIFNALMVKYLKTPV